MISVEYQNLLDKETNQTLKFRTKDCIGTNAKLQRTDNADNQTKFQLIKLKPNLCHHRDE